MKRVGIIFTAVFVLWHLCCGILLASPTTVYQAEKVVTGWLKADAQPLGAALGHTLKKTDVFRDEQGQVIYYIVYLEPAGFAIVPADDMVEPILGFAEAGTYDPSPDNPLGALVNQDVKKRISASRDILTIQGADTKAFRKTKSKWDSLTAKSQLSEEFGILSLPSISDLRVNPLLKTKWSQTTCCDTPKRACYNFYTPPFLSGDSNNFPCGCVATAMAQLMRFHEYPTAGIGVHTFKISVNNNPPYDANTRGGNGLGGPYAWNSMVYEPNCNTTGPQRQAIGALCYDAGVTVNMDYSAAGSRAVQSQAKTALKNTFTYSNVFYKNSVNPGIALPVPGLIKMINPNLDYEHPVLISIQPGGEGHAVVVDGYGYNVGTMYHHINMGWSGASDAWYNFYNDMPLPPDYTSVDCCVYNIFVTGAGEIISGRVTDAYGNVLSGETVTAVRTDGGTYQATTNDRGIYVLAHVPGASTYTISITKPGYGFSSRVVDTGISADTGTIGNVWAVDFSPFDPNTIFVDVTATGNNDGSNWTDAYKYLQDAISAASSGKIIVVAEGTYYPDANSANPDGDGNRFKTFQLQSSVVIYGGFPSGGSNNWSDRDINTNQTILSGDIGVPDNNSDNSYHIVSGGGTDNTTVLDGFTIRQGNANGAGVFEKIGAGIYNNNGSPTIRNCMFTQNFAETGATAIRNSNHSNTTVTNCTFVGNGPTGIVVTNSDSNVVFTACVFSENPGGALYTYGSSTSRVTGCRFLKNTGGAIQNYRGSHEIVNCIFFGNSAQTGGGIFNRACSPRITNCVFSGNTVSSYGGGVFNREDSSPTLTNCTFCDNHASSYGGGIYNDSLTCAPTITNCIVWCNTDVNGTGASSQIYEGIPSVKFSCIQDDNPNDTNIPFGGAANHNIDDNPLFGREPYDGGDGWGNANDDYGDLHLLPGSPCIDDGNNTAVPADVADLDADGNTTEQTPLDLDLRSRFADGDCNSTVVVDMGAYEFAWPFIGDFDHDCNIDFVDFAFLASAWMENNPLVDITPPPAGDGIVDFKDLAVLCDNWLAGK